MRPCLVILVALALVACSQKAEEEAAADSAIHRTLDATILASIADDDVEVAILDYVRAKIAD